MYARTFGATTQGVDGLIISVEVDSTNGMPAFDVVGLPSTVVRESKERVRTAIKNSGLRMHTEKITINFAPAVPPLLKRPPPELESSQVGQWIHAARTRRFIELTERRLI